MKTRAVIVALTLALVSTLLFAGCSVPFATVVTASDPVVTRDYTIADFTGVDSGAIFQLEIVPSSTYSVAVTANENVFQYIEVTKSGSALKLELRNGVSFTGPMTLKAKVTMPELRALSLSGASSASAEGFKSTQDFRVVISGASRLDMDIETGKFVADISGAGRASGSLKGGDSQIRLSGAANLELEGTGANMVIDGSGASSASLTDFRVKDARVTLSGGSRASIAVDGRLDVNISGGSALQYAGNPTMGKVDVTGGSTLRKSGS